jgi:hypothetical protein
MTRTRQRNLFYETRNQGSRLNALPRNPVHCLKAALTQAMSESRYRGPDRGPDERDSGAGRAGKRPGLQ